MRCNTRREEVRARPRPSLDKGTLSCPQKKCDLLSTGCNTRSCAPQGARNQAKTPRTNFLRRCVARWVLVWFGAGKTASPQRGSALGLGPAALRAARSSPGAPPRRDLLTTPCPLHRLRLHVRATRSCHLCGLRSPAPFRRPGRALCGGWATPRGPGRLGR